MVADRQSRVTFLAADLLSAAQPSPTSSQKTRVGVFRRRPSGRLSRRGRGRSMFAPGSRACAYKTASGLGKWPNHDPFGEAGGINLYEFGGNSPANAIDPFGLWWWDGDYIQWGVGSLLGLTGAPGTASAAWSGFGEGYSKGAQGVANDFTGGLFSSQGGYFYEDFDQLDKDAWGSGIRCDSAFKFGSAAGRVSEGALLAAGGVWGWNALELPTMNVAVGSGDLITSPIHVAYGVGDTWVNAVGTSLGDLTVSTYLADQTAASAYFTVTGIPVLNAAAVTATGGTAWTCVTAAGSAFLRGWLP